MMNPPTRSALSLAGLLVVMLALGGCNFAGLIAAPMQDIPDKREVSAEYRGLDGRTVAVVANVDEVTLFGHPKADANVVRAVSGRIAALVPGAKVVNPKDIIAFMNENPYWNTLLYSDLIEKLGVDRVVVVGLVDYATNEPGNAHVMRGRISANVGVVEHPDAAPTTSDPDNFAYAKVVSVQFPEESTVGVVNSDRQTIELGMLARFGQKVARLFADHTVEVPD